MHDFWTLANIFSGYCVDDRGKLGKVTALFQSLVENGESQEDAIDTLVALLV